MSKSIGNNLTHQSLLPSTVFEQKGKHTFFQAQATSRTNESPLLTTLHGQRLKSRTNKFPMGKCVFSGFARAVLTTSHSQLGEKFNLGRDIELQVDITSGSVPIVEFKVSSTGDRLFLHWGAIKSSKEKWILPERCPQGTYVYKSRACRTPFVKSESHAFLRIEIHDPAIQALEFLIYDEAHNKWYKYNGDNFHIKLPARDLGAQNVSVPEDLVQIQSYLRWERNGKQMYSPDQEKKEYEAARAELIEEVARGTSVQDLRSRLTKKNDSSDKTERPVSVKQTRMPDDLIQIQPMVAKQSERKNYSTAGRIQRKNRDIMHVLNKNTSQPVEVLIKKEQRALSPIELYAKKIEETEDSVIIKKKYSLGEKELVVLTAKSSSKTKVYLVTDHQDAVTLHWALSRRPGEWLAPPSHVLPPGSIALDLAVETQFLAAHPDPKSEVQSIEITIDDADFVGMSFVLLSNGNWIKDKGSDFYIEFKVEPKQAQKDTGDGRGTAKELLDRIAELESEAQKSFMHREEMEEGGLQTSGSSNETSPPSITLVKKQFCGKYAISSDEFTSEMVGAKSRNIAYLKGKVPSSVGIPTSVALPFGVFEEVLSDDLNQAVAAKLQHLKKSLYEGDFGVLGSIRQTVLELLPPPQLVKELKEKMISSGMPWPGDEGPQRWGQAWMAIKKVWASKWNERAYFSTRKVNLNHDYLCMAVLVQEVVNADYAFVIHTTNPSSGDSSEIYAEVVKGLGETLVGAYPGRALSFICKKNDLNSPQVLGYPSKPIGLFIRRSIIFLSDSNGEDLDGYAGAGLYDSVAMDEEEKVVLDYSSDQLIKDGNFRESILSSIAGAGNAIEELYGTPQDIEGVVRDGKIFVVQTRPQM